MTIAVLEAVAGAAPVGEEWRFDNLQTAGGHAVEVLGKPKVVMTGAGAVVEFDGARDALLAGVHPLAAAEAFSFEVIFRPDAGGPAEQRFFHLQEDGTASRMLLETRLVGDEWCLDSFAVTGANSLALLDRGKLHPVGRWYAVASVYDGAEFRNYVDGVLQGRGPLRLGAQGAGRASVGTRIDRRDFFKGAMYSARFTRRALAEGELLRVPKGLRPGI